MATWHSVSGAKGYLLDVSTSNSFSSYVDGYHGLDVGDVNGRAVTGLKPGTTYYYRVRPYTAASSGGYLNVTTATTQAATGLIIIPTFDCSNEPLRGHSGHDYAGHRDLRVAVQRSDHDPDSFPLLHWWSGTTQR